MADQLIVRALLKVRVKVTEPELEPLTTLRWTAVPSFQFTSMLARLPSTSVALSVMLYGVPATTLAPLVLTSVSAGALLAAVTVKLPRKVPLGEPSLS